MMTEARRRGVHEHSLEEETLGFTHEILGGVLLDGWRCPIAHVQRVAVYHASLSEEFRVDDLVLPAANQLSQALGYGSSGEIYLPPLPPSLWDQLNLPVEKLLQVCRQLDDNVRHLRVLFSPPRQN